MAGQHRLACHGQYRICLSTLRPAETVYRPIGNNALVWIRAVYRWIAGDPDRRFIAWSGGSELSSLFFCRVMQ
jgi:hypothetical protein